jgi:hypothetical protein
VLAKVLANILHNRLTLRDDDVLFSASGPDTDGRRLSEGMDGLFEVQLFKQPDDALATRLVEPGIVRRQEMRSEMMVPWMLRFGENEMMVLHACKRMAELLWLTSGR